MKIIRHIASVIFALIGLIWLSGVAESGALSFLSGLSALLAAAFVSPLLSKYLNKWVRIGGLIIALLGIGGFSHLMFKKNQALMTEQKAEADKLFANINPLLESGKIDSAAAYAKTIQPKYADPKTNPATSFLKEYDSLNSPTFFEKKLLSISNIQLEDIKKGFAVHVFENKALNARMMEKLIEGEEHRAIILADAKREQEHKKRQESIKKQFSEWDGSHRNLEAYIKRNMNDPSSYEHVETRYEAKDSHLIVATKFRGKNAFNGTVTNLITAKVSMNGQILEILE